MDQVDYSEWPEAAVVATGANGRVTTWKMAGRPGASIVENRLYVHARHLQIAKAIIESRRARAWSGFSDWRCE